VTLSASETTQHYTAIHIDAVPRDFFEQQPRSSAPGWQKYFRYIEIVVDKTPETYRGVLAKYHLEPQKFLMVGNSLRSDILPVLSIGGQAVYVPYESTWAHENVDESAQAATKYNEIEHLGQLPELIKSL
jgi:putative hydrolase of the HAD superfamily